MVGVDEVVPGEPAREEVPELDEGAHGGGEGAHRGRVGVEVQVGARRAEVQAVADREGDRHVHHAAERPAGLVAERGDVVVGEAGRDRARDRVDHRAAEDRGVGVLAHPVHHPGQVGHEDLLRGQRGGIVEDGVVVAGDAVVGGHPHRPGVDVVGGRGGQRSLPREGGNRGDGEDQGDESAHRRTISPVDPPARARRDLPSSRRPDRRLESGHHGDDSQGRHPRRRPRHPLPPRHQGRSQGTAPHRRPAHDPVHRRGGGGGRRGGGDPGLRARQGLHRRPLRHRAGAGGAPRPHRQGGAARRDAGHRQDGQRGHGPAAGAARPRPRRALRQGAGRRRALHRDAGRRHHRRGGSGREAARLLLRAERPRHHRPHGGLARRDPHVRHRRRPAVDDRAPSASSGWSRSRRRTPRPTWPSSGATCCRRASSRSWSR